MHERLVVLGSGESGLGAALLAKKNNLEVFISDNNVIPDERKNILIQNRIPYEEVHNINNLINASEIVKSPGIPNNKLIRELKRKNIPIISEVEFASRYTRAKIIGITGSNGKTTTTLLLGHILKKAKFDVLIAGNIGAGFSKEIINRDYQFIVLELSSFQLDDIKKFRPDVAIILNITPDHLDRYDNNFQDYKKSKYRISMNQRSSDFLIYNMDNTALDNLDTKASKIPISLKKELDKGAYYYNKKINIKLNNKTMTINELALQGKHNIFNSMAAAVAARVFEVKDSVIRQSLIDFEGIEHRLENVLTVHGVNFINDSKATNVHATWYALESMDRPVIWIVGGVDKGNDYSTLLDLVKQKVKAIICLGMNSKKIQDSFKTCVKDFVHATDMREAVEKSYALANHGDSVLMSPACASFDLFTNFEERGVEFKNQVRKL
tara:strand:+ start:241 stop:1554 length:1314 start_codon:yes stop_codon:yes gene_type:complete